MLCLYERAENCSGVAQSGSPHSYANIFPDALGIPTGRIRVVKPYVGGAFGKQQDMFYEPLAALFTLRLGGRCVAFVMSREETFVNSRTRHAMDIWAAACVDDTGRNHAEGHSPECIQRRVRF
ncbi:MAG: molybdopterin cofactor-binding domain-containing protein [Dysosmobacter welbionis]